MEGIVYFLKDEKGKFYVGSTDDLERRLYQHKIGHTQTTRRMFAPRLVFSQKYDNLEQARKIELRIKSFKRKDYIEKIIEDGYIKIV